MFTSGDRAEEIATKKPWGIMTLKCSLTNHKETSVGGIDSKVEAIREWDFRGGGHDQTYRALQGISQDF